MDESHEAVNCDKHPDQKLHHFCVPCNRPICSKCGDHSGHPTKDLQQVLSVVKRELDKGVSRVSGSRGKLQSALAEMKEERGRLEEKKGAVQQLIKQREEKLVELFRQECRLAREESLAQLESVMTEMQAAITQDETSVGKKIHTVDFLKKEVKQALESRDHHKIFTLREEMATGSGSPENLRHPPDGVVPHKERPALHCDYTLLMPKDTIRSFIGSAVKVNSLMMSSDVAVKRVYSCSDDVMCDVHAICPLADGRVWVAYGDVNGAGSVALFNTSGQVERKEAVQGRVCIVRGKDNWVRVEGKDFKPKFMTSQESNETSYSSDEKQYAVYTKLEARYEVFVQHAGACDLRSVKVLDRDAIATAYSRLCSISCTHPIAIDVSKDGKLFAIIEEDQDHVLIYHQGYNQPVCGYTGNNASFKPRDVCFCEVDGKERLLVADWQDDSLHVLDVTRTGCTFVGHLAAGCPLLMKPTALCPDSNGRLWIGCSGGQVLRVEDITSSHL